ncbi:MAG: alpha/beta fold hydrolase [Candidatus Binataceae bacterium]
MPVIKSGSVNIHYETYGEGDPLLLIMGLGMPGAVWIPSLALLPGFECIYFDNRGTGTSDRPDIPYTARDMAEDAIAILDHLRIPKAHVYGVSMGGMIAQELALNHPERVKKLVLGCTWAGGPTVRLSAPEIMARLIQGAATLRTDREKGIDILLPVLLPPEFIGEHPEVKAMIMATLADGQTTPIETIQRAMLGLTQFNAYDRLPQVKCPVLIVHGEKDVLIPPENAAILKSRIPHAEVYRIPNAGHAYQIADMLGVHQRIVTFLKS